MEFNDYYEYEINDSRLCTGFGTKYIFPLKHKLPVLGGTITNETQVHSSDGTHRTDSQDWTYFPTIPGQIYTYQADGGPYPKVALSVFSQHLDISVQVANGGEVKVDRQE